ncbi:MAG: sensor histidine kinase [Ruminococcus sp.]|nr:sensor histidine kinase [Ruminococcus sp.]
MKLVTSVKNFSIRNQMVSMFLIVILPMFAASIILLLNMRSIVKNSAMDTALRTTDSIKLRITDIVDSTENIADNLSSAAGAAEAIKNGLFSQNGYSGFYGGGQETDYIRFMPQIYTIFSYTEENGKDYNMKRPDPDNDNGWYKKALLSPDTPVWDVVRDPDDGMFRLSCIKCVRLGGITLGTVVIMISDAWIERLVPEDSSIILSVNRGSVYYSSYSDVAAGDVIDPGEEFMVSSVRKTYDNGLGYIKGYTALNNFYDNFPFQIIMIMPRNTVNSDIDRVSVVYGGYCALMIILSMFIIILFTSVFSRRITLLSDKMHSVATGDFEIEFNDTGADEIADLYRDMRQMIDSMRSMMDDVYTARIQNEAFKFDQMQAEFKALSSQINPHFLYNTLETIRMKAYCNNDRETADLVKKLGKFMRRCLEFKDTEVTLHSELEFTSSYLELQSARFGERISYSIYCEVDKDYTVLPLLIQPVVENAFVHGIESSKANGRIDIRIYYHGEAVIADVTDNGCGMTGEKLEELREKLKVSDTSSGKSIGLTNVNKRIKMYHGEEYGLTVKTKLGQGTTIRITLPRYKSSGNSLSAGSV